jgi:hypothetical protein
MAVKADGNGRNTPNLNANGNSATASYGMPGNNSGHPPTISDVVDPASHGANPGTPQVENALEGLTMCSDNPGSNAPRSNVSVNAHVLSVQNLPADNELDLNIFETLNELGDLSDENELLKLFDTVN